MPASDRGERLPPLAAEDHACDVCALVYPQIRIDDAVNVIAGLPGAVREAVSAIPPGMRRARPGPDVWSVSEYVCHLRDVYVTFTIRLHRIRTEHRPALEPMFNDLRARRFRYNDCDLAATLDELAAAAAGFRDEVARTGNATGIAWVPVCRASSAPRAGWYVRRCTKASTTSATSGESVKRCDRATGIWL